MKRLSWKYIAGFIDGEGCIDLTVTHGKYIQPRVRITQAAIGKDVLDVLSTNHGGKVYLRRSQNANWQDAYSWELTGYSPVCMLLRNVANHMIVKKEQARLILWMERNVKGKVLAPEARDTALNELKAMKRDPHRLSERAQETLSLVMRQSDGSLAVGNVAGRSNCQVQEESCSS